MCNAIREWQKKIRLTNIKKKMSDPVIPHHLQIFLKNRKGTKDMYTILNQGSDEATDKKRWNKTYQFEDESWRKIFLWPFSITKDTALNHHILATNQFLHKIKYIDNASCSFCADQEESIYHLLWECKHTKALIEELRKWPSDNNILINVSEISFIFGLYNKDTSIAEQQILLETKYYIYFCKCSQASLNLKA